MRASLLPVNSALARPLVPWLIRLRVSANAVTFLSMFSGILGGVVLAQGTGGTIFLGTLLFLLANLLDECDGKVARQTNTCSSFGRLLDTVTDSIVHTAFFLGLGIGMHRQFPQGPWAFLGFVAAGGSVLSCVLDVGGVTPWQPPGEAPSRSPTDRLAWVSEWLRIDFSLLVVLGAAFHQTAWILWSGALGVFLFWIPSTFLIAVRSRQKS